MKLLIHDENSNEYLSKMFFAPLLSFDKRFTRISTTDGVRDSAILIHGDKLNPARIQQLKEAGNRLICFDINDSSYLSSSYINSEEQDLLDLIFKVSGVPKRNEIAETNLDRNFQIQISAEKYLPDDKGAEFERIRPRIRPLPYVLWNPLVDSGYPVVPVERRRGKVLIRGGNHFWRVVLAFRLMQEGLLDERSEFHTGAYFNPKMERRFQYCDECKAEKSSHGRSLYDAPMRHQNCTNPATGWNIEGEFFGGPMFGRREHGYWNNRCPHSFLQLAKEYERCRGPLDKDFLEKLFNGDMRPHGSFVPDLSSASYAGDSKWLNTINIPPRFWEAASLGTPSLYLDRTQDQDYWPHMTAGEHFKTYPENMGIFPIRGDDEPREWTEISRAVKALYEEKMRGTDHSISNSLLKYMVGAIDEIL